MTKTYQPHFICFGNVLVEIKALSILSGTEESKLINYLKATGLHVGLLINFGAKSLEHKRYVYNLRESAPAPVEAGTLWVFNQGNLWI